MMDLDVNEVFDYASFMWNGADIDGSLPQAIARTGLNQTPGGEDNDSLRSPTELMTWPSPSSLPLSESELLDLFSRSNAPPILLTAESSLRWSTIRKLFTSMTSTSAMVRHAVLAFSSLRQAGIGKHDTQSRLYYDKLKNALSEMLEGRKQVAENHDNTHVTYALATLFVLVYIDVGLHPRTGDVRTNIEYSSSLTGWSKHTQISEKRSRLSRA
jgi:hypothetical protein